MFIEKTGQWLEREAYIEDVMVAADVVVNRCQGWNDINLPLANAPFIGPAVADIPSEGGDLAESEDHHHLIERRIGEITRRLIDAQERHGRNARRTHLPREGGMPQASVKVDQCRGAQAQRLSSSLLCFKGSLTQFKE